MRALNLRTFAVAIIINFTICTMMNNAVAQDSSRKPTNENPDDASWETPAALAQYLALAIEDDAHRAQALTQIGTAQARSDDKQQAVETLKLALESAKMIRNARQKTSILEQIALGFVWAGDTDLVQVAINSTGELHGRPAIRQRIVFQYIAMGDWKNALLTVEAMDDGFSRTTLLTDIASAQIRRNDRSAALETLALAIDSARKAGSSNTKASTMHRIATTMFLAEDRLQALATLDEARENALVVESAKSRAKVLSEIAMTQIQEGETSKGFETLNQALDAAKAIDDRSSRSLALSQMALSFTTNAHTGKMKTTFTPEESEFVKKFVTLTKQP